MFYFEVRIPQSQLEEPEWTHQHKQQLAEKILLKKQGAQADLYPELNLSIKIESSPRDVQVVKHQQLEHLTSYVAPTLADSGWAFSSVVYYPSYQLYAVYQWSL